MLSGSQVLAGQGTHKQTYIQIYTMLHMHI